MGDYQLVLAACSGSLFWAKAVVLSTMKQMTWIVFAGTFFFSRNGFFYGYKFFKLREIGLSMGDWTGAEYIEKQSISCLID